MLCKFEISLRTLLIEVRGRFTFHLSRIPILNLGKKSLPTGHRYTRELEIVLREFANRTFGVPHDTVSHIKLINNYYVSFVVRVLREMPNLHTLRFVAPPQQDKVMLTRSEIVHRS